jgi:DNA-binding MarR family transcriptional regulator
MLSQLGLATSRAFGELVGRFGIEPRHFAILASVSRAPGISQQRLGEHLQIPASTMVALVDHLERKGLLSRRHLQDDRRVRALYLTSRGADTVERALDLARRHEASMSVLLDDAERAQLLRSLRKVATALGITSLQVPDRGAGLGPGSDPVRSSDVSESITHGG